MHRRPTEGLPAAKGGWSVLVITRKAGQRLRIGEAWITVLSARRGHIRLGVEAPADVEVVREELDGPEPKETSHAS